MNISMSLNIMQIHIKLYVRKTPFLVLIATKRKMTQSKKLNVKTSSRPYTKRTDHRAHSKMCHLDMLAQQTHIVEL